MNKSNLTRKQKRVLRRQKLRTKYRLSIMNEKTFAEAFYMRLSIYNVFLIVATLSLILILIVYLVIAYTPLKEYVIPNYPELEEREKIEKNAELVDSLEYQMKLYTQKMQVLQTILNGDDPSEYAGMDSIITTSAENYSNLNFSPSTEDSLFRLEIQETEAFNVNFQAGAGGVRIENLFFYPPVIGEVSTQFRSGHYGTDVSAPINSIIHSVLDGTVIFDGWTVETDYMIIIQHTNDFVSVYKHNAKLLKKAGDKVIAGEGIALLGNLDYSVSEPHLHFELWHEGKPVNSENYIVY